MEIKITKKELLNHWNNSCSTGWEYLIHGRIYNDDKTRFSRFKFVLWIDGMDYAEYLDNGDGTEIEGTEETFKEYLNECIYGYTGLITEFSDKGTKDFYELCKESIERYNRNLRRDNCFYYRA